MKIIALILITTLKLNSICLAQANEVSKLCTRVFDKDLNEFVYMKLPEPPSYPGGTSAWQRFLNNNMRYPESEIDNGTYQSTTVATFIVDKEGNLIKFGIKGRSYNNWTPFDSAFVNTIRKSIRWNPGKCDGKNVFSYFEQAIVACPIYLE